MEPLQFKIPFPSHQQRGYGLYVLTEILKEVIGGYRHVCKTYEWREDYVFEIRNFYEEDSRDSVIAGADRLQQAMSQQARDAAPIHVRPRPRNVVNGELMRFLVGENRRGNMGSVLVSIGFRDDGQATRVIHGPRPEGGMEHSWNEAIAFAWKWLELQVVSTMTQEAKNQLVRASNMERTFLDAFKNTEKLQTG